MKYSSPFLLQVLTKSSAPAASYSTIPTNIPHMVKLVRFYETEYSIFLVLELAPGGKLWNYVSSYLNQQASGFQQDDDDVFSDEHERKLRHPDTFVEVPAKTLSRQGLLNIPESPSGHSSQSSVESNEGCAKGYAELFRSYTPNVGSKFSSLYEGEQKDETEGGHTRCSSTTRSLSEPILGDDFESVINSTKPLMTHFSINSVDSDRGWHDRAGTDYDRHTSISENVEFEPSSGDRLRNASQNVQSETSLWIPSSVSGRETSFQFGGNRDHGQVTSEQSNTDTSDVEQLISSARELMKSVDETLQKNIIVEELPGQVNKTMQNPVSEAKPKLQESSNNADFASVLESSEKFENISENSSVPHTCRLRNEELTVANINDVSSSEISADDVLHSHHMCTSACTCSTTTLENSETADVETSTGSIEAHHECSDVDASTPTESSGLVKRKKGRWKSGGIPRSSSGEMRRMSVGDRSFEGNRPRVRTLSAVFEQLDMLAAESSNVTLPETCVRVWLAEIVVAISKLHDLGIVCRYK